MLDTDDLEMDYERRDDAKPTHYLGRMVMVGTMLVLGVVATVTIKIAIGDSGPPSSTASTAMDDVTGKWGPAPQEGVDFSKVPGGDGQECVGDDLLIAQGLNLAQCAAYCRGQIAGCKFFLHGIKNGDWWQEPKKDSCWFERTASQTGSCTLKPNKHYNAYKFNPVPTAAPATNPATQAGKTDYDCWECGQLYGRDVCSKPVGSGSAMNKGCTYGVCDNVPYSCLECIRLYRSPDVFLPWQCFGFPGVESTQGVKCDIKYQVCQ